MSKKQNKTPPNKPTLDALKANDWNIKIVHYRKVFDYNQQKEVLVEDRVWRNSIRKLKGLQEANIFEPVTYSYPNELGGSTKMIFERGEEKIETIAECSKKENFSRRTGVKICLGRFKKALEK